MRFVVLSMVLFSTLGAGCVAAQSPSPASEPMALKGLEADPGQTASDATVGARPSPSPSPAASPAPEADPTDRDIAGFVERKLRLDTLLANDPIRVAAADGIVTLTGSASSLQAKDRAVKGTMAIRGVRSVVDRVDVRAISRSDADIKQDIDAALLLDPVTESFEIEPTVRDGLATLTGKVSSWAERAIAEEVVRGVKGVKRIENSLSVQWKDSRSDTELAGEIQRRLSGDGMLAGNQLTVDVKQGRAVITGTVPSAWHLSRALGLAWVMNVKDVDASRVLVDPKLARTTPRRPSDEEIRQALTTAFVHDPRVLSWNPDVTVHDGVVTLRGTVTNRDAVRAAERDARSTVGVRDVINLLRVEPRARRTDAEINRDVLAAMRRDSWLDDDSIHASTARGVVTLTGEVDAAYEQTWADTLAGRVNGVTQVVNLLTLPAGRMFYYGVTTWLPADAMRDERIRQSIESQMMWSPFVDADEVHTAVNTGVATLTGKVDSWSERAAAVENAYEGGALSVVDKLEVEW